MDDLFSGSPSAPPQSVVIQDPEPAQPPNQTFDAVTLSGQTSHFQNVAAPQYGYQVPLAAGNKPSLLMLGISILRSFSQSILSQDGASLLLIFHLG